MEKAKFKDQNGKIGNNGKDKKRLNGNLAGNASPTQYITL